MSATNAIAQVDAAASSYQRELNERAQQLKLSETTAWRALGYYYPDWFTGGVTSLVDSDAFFAAPSGKTEPDAELQATIARFFEPLGNGDPNAHPQCRWIARFRWLNSQLMFDPARMPAYACPDFEAWLGEVNPHSVSLIFPAAYLNNPSSMFGHTLLRIDPPGGSEAAPLISYALNFAADHQGEQGVAFALKGLGGGYEGYFSLLPYYEKVKQYNDIESRDILEYPLQMTPNEIRKMLESVWELDGNGIDYYFFTTNCSFVLLAVLRTGRPDVPLHESLPFYAVPVDTLRATVGGFGLSGPPVFRPSAYSRVRDLQRRLSKLRQRLALKLAAGEVTTDDPTVETLPPGQRARLIELAQSYLQYQLDSGDISRDVAAPRSLNLLRARASLGSVVDEGSGSGTETPSPVPPDQGHHSARVALGAGMTGGNAFAEIRARPVYHDLLDPESGFVPGAAIELLDLRVRYYGDGYPLLESFQPFAVESLSPRDEIFRPISWRMRAAVDRFRSDGGDDGTLIGVFEGGVGGTWPIAAETAAASIVTIGPEAAVFSGPSGLKERIAGLGPAVSVLTGVGKEWKMRLHAGWQGTAGYDGFSDRFSVGAAYAHTIDRNLSLRVEAAAINSGGSTYPEWMATISWHF
jgi:hypothetical protein